MKLNRLLTLCACLIITSCGDNNLSSTTIENDSSTSFVESEEKKSSTIYASSDSSNVIEEDFYSISEGVDFNKLNKTEGLTPSKGEVDILLIPIEFEDISTSIDRSLLDKAFNSKNDETIEWYSVSEYYETSSYGNLNMNFQILDSYTPKNISTYYTSNYENSEYTNASSDIVLEALSFYDNEIDFSNYDSNNDGYIDGVYLIYNRPVDKTFTFSLWWAYTYYLFNNSKTFDNLKVKGYVFAGYDFLKDNNQQCNTHTYIHETAHLFGVDDYYDYYPTAGSTKGGLAGADMMDGTIGDHNAFTKAMLGWNEGKVISTSKQSITVDLSAFSVNGEYLILTNDFDENKGLLQEYFVLEYYTPTLLNEKDKMYAINGIRVLHVVADTKKDGTFKYDNSVSGVKLISQITTSNGGTYLTSKTERSDDTLFVEGESLDIVKFTTDEKLKYSFKVETLTDEKATLTITLK